MKNIIAFLLFIMPLSMLAQQWQGANPIYYNGGNVGIGTSSPSYKTVISNNGANGLEIDPVGNQFSEGVGIQTYNRAASVYVPFQIYSSKLLLQGGNVGIGTTSPSYKAVVSNNGGSGLEIDPTGNQLPGGVGIQTYNRATSAYVPFQIYSSKILLQGGNVGIGTTDPGSFKLAVEGKIYGKEVQVALTNPGPDYVFAPTYNLPTLESIKTYIDQHKHLPEMPSAKEMEANGINLGEMNMLLLKKVEELTLHLIEQNNTILEQGKTIANQNARISNLENKLK